jgi:hypothetical protein
MATVRFELEIEGVPAPVAAEIEGTLDAVLMVVRTHLQEGDIRVFERNCDDEFVHAGTRTAMRLVAHRAKRVDVKVHFEQHTKSHDFAPSATVYKVLQWAIEKHGFDLDETARAKANLMLPGADAPLPREAVIGSLFGSHDCNLVLELTLKDFTNGRV